MNKYLIILFSFMLLSVFTGCEEMPTEKRSPSNYQCFKCKKSVQAGEETVLIQNGKTFYFCSRQCLDEFKAYNDK